jgi:hypothetical protein
VRRLLNDPERIQRKPWLFAAAIYALALGGTVYFVVHVIRSRVPDHEIRPTSPVTSASAPPAVTP